MKVFNDSFFDIAIFFMVQIGFIFESDFVLSIGK